MNHLATVLKHLPKSIARRISSNKNVFTELILIYQEALKRMVSQKLLLILEMTILMATTQLRGKDVNGKLFGLIYPIT